MVTFTKVLCPTDLSEASRPALAYAAAVARRYGARLTVLHAAPPFEPLLAPPGDAASVGPLALPTIDELVGAVRTFVGDALAGVEADVRVHPGDPSPVIVDQAVATDADLIVMGTHGRSGFDRLLAGSVTEKVLRRAPCPVLTIPPHAAAAPASGTLFAHILCAVDFSDASGQALGLALELAREGPGAVTVATVLEWLAEEAPLTYPEFDIGPYRARLVDDAAVRLRDLVQAAGAPAAGEVEQVVALGRAYREILRLAGEKGSDLIVMGAQGRGGIGLALFGSTTQQVVRGAPCPVLVVHRPLP
jgi:nucleotide-binding universal stress UspA family protein